MKPEMSAPNGAPTMESGGENGKTGAIIGILVIVIILVIGALYFWGQRLVETPNTEETSPTVFQPTESTSTEITDIESDLGATVLEGLDTDLENINAELGI